MSKRSRAAYYAQVERVYSWCEKCPTTGARYSKRDKQYLCKSCRAELRKEGKHAQT